MTLIIGLTGGIATGKSTVSSMVSQLGIPTIDADKIARQVVEPGKKAHDQIVQTFGEQILKSDQTLDRQALGSIIFSNKDKRKQLNAIVHPAVRKEMIKQRDHYIGIGVKSVMLDIPLLFESNLVNLVHKVIVVYVHEKKQLYRLMARDHLSEEEALQRIQAQMPISEKVTLADVVIDNSCTKEETLRQIKYTLQQWSAL